jgi:hypothetical protein
LGGNGDTKFFSTKTTVYTVWIEDRDIKILHHLPYSRNLA